MKAFHRNKKKKNFKEKQVISFQNIDVNYILRDIEVSRWVNIFGLLTSFKFIKFKISRITNNIIMYKI